MLIVNSHHAIDHRQIIILAHRARIRTVAAVYRRVICQFRHIFHFYPQACKIRYVDLSCQFFYGVDSLASPLADRIAAVSFWTTPDPYSIFVGNSKLKLFNKVISTISWF
jgi:hypothetical protein